MFKEIFLVSKQIMATGTIKDRLKLTTLLENATPVIYNPNTSLLTGVDKYKIILVTYLYGLTGLEYTTVIMLPLTRGVRLSVFDNANVYTDVFVSHNGALTTQLNGSTSGVYIKRIVGAN